MELRREDKLNPKYSQIQYKAVLSVYKQYIDKFLLFQLVNFMNEFRPPPSIEHGWSTNLQITLHFYI